MPEIDVRPLDPSDAQRCAELLAARHERDFARLGHLEPALREASGWRPLIEPLLANPRADGVAAVRGPELVGFLIGERMLLPPNDFASQFIPPRSIQIGLEGHAVAAGEDSLAVYRAMYAVLARPWVDAGFFTHRAAIVAGDSEAQEAWLTLGFGRYMSAATRDTATPVPVTRQRTLNIERASPEDLEDVLALAEELDSWHWQSPMFWPVIHDAEQAVREFNLSALRSADVPAFVAYAEGRPVGMQTFLRPGFTPPIVKRDSDVYLFEGVVSDADRGGGVGQALLAHSMEWAVRSGYESCTLHFASGNPSGAPFWLGHGFAPVEHTMERVIDSRVAWARPKPV
ncbi:MAG: GNAT family N-acetyltransferase [bacterium]